MALITGSAYGTTTQQEEIYLEGVPTIFIQDYEADLMFAPDSDGFYWQLSGTNTYPVYEIGCVTDVSLTEDLTLNNVLCDNKGVADTVQARNFIEFNFSVQSFFPFTVLRHLLLFGAVTENAVTHTEKFGMGKINNAQAWHVWAPKVYDEDAGDYVAIMLHRCKFVDPWSIDMPFGSNWTASGLKLRAYVDSTVPAAQQFGMFLRSDASVI